MIPNIKLLAIAIPSAVLIALVIWYVRDAEQSKERLAMVNYQLDQALYAAKANEGAVRACEAINHANATEAARLTEKVREAELRLAAANATADAEVENINREETTLRATGVSCPAIDSRFRNWLRGNP